MTGDNEYALNHLDNFKDCDSNLGAELTKSTSSTNWSNQPTLTVQKFMEGIYKKQIQLVFLCFYKQYKFILVSILPVNILFLVYEYIVKITP